MTIKEFQELQALPYPQKLMRLILMFRFQRHTARS